MSRILSEIVKSRMDSGVQQIYHENGKCSSCHAFVGSQLSFFDRGFILLCTFGGRHGIWVPKNFNGGGINLIMFISLVVSRNFVKLNKIY